jgi:hypothetical protein
LRPPDGGATLRSTARAGTRGTQTRRTAGLALATACAILLFTAVPAGATVFEVNTTADTADPAIDGTCDVDTGTPNEQCTLRAALAEAEANTTADDIGFDETAVMDNVINVVATFPVITQPLTINGCSDPTAMDGGKLDNPQPCVELRWDNAGTGIGTGLNFNSVQAWVVKGLAFTRWNTALRYSDINSPSTGESFVAQNNWFGTKLNGTAEANQFGLAINGDNATIGGDENGTGPTERNVFSNNTSTALQIASADNVTVQGNYFGTTPSGTTAASPGQAENIEIVRTQTPPTEDTPNDNLIGGTVTSGQASTAVCDGVCNVIAGANGAMNTAFGIDLHGESAFSEQPAGSTTIAGNFVGLKADGTALANLTQAIRVGNADGVTIGGASAAARNYITGGFFGVTTVANPDDLVVRNNFIGLNPPGSALVSPPSVAGVLLSSSSATDPPTIDDNRIALGTGGDSSIQVAGSVNTVVTDNVIGIGTGGEDLGGGGIGIRTNEMNGATIEGNTIGNAGIGVGIGIGLTLESSDDNQIHGNFIGTDSTGADRGNDGPGIRILEFTPSNGSTGNVIGGDSAPQENVISHNNGDAIEVTDASSDDNQFKRNRGTDNVVAFDMAGSLFIDLNADGPDPATPAHNVNDGVGPPAITSVVQDSATGTAAPGAEVRVFRKASSSPGEVASFLGQATADGSGQWQVSYGSLPADTLVTATQTVGGAPASTSELAAPVASPAPPQQPQPQPPDGQGSPGDTTPPDTTIVDRPKDKTKKKQATFEFTGNDARVVATFECRVDDAPFRPCASPFTVKVKKGKHTFEVRAIDAAGNADPTPASDGWKVKKKKKK